MTKERFDNLLEILLDAQPFRPFAVERIGGRKFEVDSPRSVAFRDGVAVFMPARGGPIPFDHNDLVDPN